MAITAERPIYLKLRESALLGRFPSNRPIDMRKLEAECRASSIPIREALIELAAEDLVDFVPGHGFFGKKPNYSEFISTLDLLGYLLIDAAEFIFAHKSHHQALRDICKRRALIIEPDALETRAYDVLNRLRLIFVHYRTPHARFLENAICRLSLLLTHNRTVTGGVSIAAAIEIYLSLLVKGDLPCLRHGVCRFINKMKANLPDVLESDS